MGSYIPNIFVDFLQCTYKHRYSTYLFIYSLLGDNSDKRLPWLSLKKSVTNVYSSKPYSVL